MHPDFQHYNPERIPPWRYERALEIVSGGRRRQPRHFDDADVRQMCDFLRRYECAPPRQQLARERLFVACPGLFFAYRLYAGHNELLKSDLEAGLLAGMTDEEIGELNQTLPSTVDWYERMFFNVRDRLHARRWVRQMVLMPALNTFADGVQQLEAATTKIFGYFGGPLVLEAILSGFKPGDTRVTSWEDLKEFFDENFELKLRTRLTVATHHLEINRYNFAELLAGHAKLKELSLRMLEGRLSKSEYSKNVETALERLELVIGDASHRIDSFNRYARTTAELRAGEQLQLSATIPIPGLEALEAESFPVPSKADENSQS